MKKFTENTLPVNETIRIGGNIQIKITQIDQKYKCARIGITAPRKVNIMREELLPLIESKHKQITNKEIL